MSLAVAFATSLIVGLALEPLAIRTLCRYGVMDVPNTRSSHTSTTPRGGGIAVIAALGAGLVTGHARDAHASILFLGCLAFGAVGLLDDFRGLGAKFRLVLILIFGAISGAVVHAPIPVLLAAPMMAIWAATFVNAFNFMDGINGISGIVGVVSGVYYMLLGNQFASQATTIAGAALAGASMSFLPFNFPRARVFLGDAGSYSMGFVIAFMGCLLWTAGAPPVVAVAPTAVYLADTGTTLLRRMRNGSPLTVAHRDHIYQQLASGDGLSHTTTALLVAGTQVFVVNSVWWGWSTGKTPIGIALSLAALIVYLGSPRLVVSKGTAQ